MHPRREPALADAPPPFQVLQQIWDLACGLRARADMPQLTLGCLELIVEGAEQSMLMVAAVDPDVDHNRAVARAVGASLVLLRDARCVGTRRVAVDEGVLRGHLLRILDRHGHALKDDGEGKESTVRMAVDDIAALTGTTLPTVVVEATLDQWALGRSWNPDSAFFRVTRDLLHRLDLGCDADALKKTWQRMRAR